jgi:hypothetical protein
VYLNLFVRGLVVTKGRGHKRLMRLAAASGAVFAALALALPAPAVAQNFFTALFGSLTTPPRPQAPIAPAYTDPRGPFDSGRSYPSYSGEEEQRTAGSSGIPGTGVYCVRTCDGRYFPVPRSGGAVAPAKMCNAMCPAAQTKVFHGSDIKWASASDGTRYNDMDTAFLYRDKVVPDCSCTGKGPGGLAQIDIESDPTLRAGDIVVTAEGPKAFKGAAAFPYRTADFTPVESYGRISSEVRRQLSSIEVDATATPATPVQKLAPQSAEPAARPRPARRTQAQYQPPANVSFFPFR